MDEVCMEAWWGRPPTKCSCARKLQMVVVGQDELSFTCSVHGLVVRGRRETKRGGALDWHYSRLAKDYTAKVERAVRESTQLSLLGEGCGEQATPIPTGTK